MSRSVNPSEVLERLLDPERIRYACDPFRNDAWKHASQMSVGKDGILCADAFADRAAIDSWAQRLTAILGGRVVPDDLALRVQLIPKAEPWKATGRPGKREIAIGGILGRCLGNHLGVVLSEMVEPLLPPCAIAYRPRRSTMVERAVLRVAADIGIGNYRYYAKLDVADCFASMPRPAVAQALRDLGFPERFIDLVMCSVGAPRYRHYRGSWVCQSSEQGCPAGLPASSSLVNVLFLEFDDWVRRHCPGLTYFRYCDDFLFLGRTRSEVEHAVAELQRFIKRLKLRLKGTSPNQSPASLVQDIREVPLTFLGAGIGPDGDVHIPAHILEGELAKIRHLMTHAAKVGYLVVGQSRYVSRSRRARGVLTFDGDDLLATVIAFHRRWFAMNQGEAKAFLGRVEREFKLNPHSKRAPYRKLWIAALGGSVNLIGGGEETDQEETSGSLERWVRAEVFPIIREAYQGVSNDTLRELLDELDALTRRGTSDLGTGWVSNRPPGAQGQSIDLIETEPLKDSLDETEEEDAKEPNGFAMKALGLDRAPRGAAHSRETSGATTMGQPAPPGRPLSLPILLLFVRHQFEPKTETTTVITSEFSEEGRALGLHQATYTGQQPATAVLDHLVERATQAKGARLVIAMEQSWLAKHLLREGLEFRSVAVMQRVRRLHAEAPSSLVMGPVEFPVETPAATS